MARDAMKNESYYHGQPQNSSLAWKLCDKGLNTKQTKSTKELTQCDDLLKYKSGLCSSKARKTHKDGINEFHYR